MDTGTATAVAVPLLAPGLAFVHHTSAPFPEFWVQATFVAVEGLVSS